MISYYVQIAAERLDRDCPGWEWFIDMDKLHMTNIHKCIAGQLGWPPITRVPNRVINISFCTSGEIYYNDDKVRYVHKLWLEQIKARLLKRYSDWNLARVWWVMEVQKQKYKLYGRSPYTTDGS